MRHESSEKKIIVALQQYTSPEPDPEFEARLKEKFMQKARETKKKQKFFRTVSWSGAAAAVVLVGMLSYYGNPIHWNDNQAGNPKAPLTDTGMKKVDPHAIQKADHWQSMDVSKLEMMDSDMLGKHDLALFRSMDKKKLYAVRKDKGVLVYESKDMEVMNARIYPFPNQPGKFYIWFMDEKVLVEGKEVKRTNHFMILQPDGQSAEIKELPQPGFNTNVKLEWSPSGNKAYLALDNGEEWMVGELQEEQQSFKGLYGQITKDSTDVNHLPEEALKWKVAWVSDTQLLVYNPGANAFYGVNIENQSAWELDAILPQFAKGDYVKSMVVPQGLKTPIAIIQVGKVIHDVSFSGSEKIYTLNLETNEFKPLDSIPVKLKESDQYHLSPNRMGDQQIMGMVSTTDHQKFSLRIGLYNLVNNQFESTFERIFPESLFINQEVKVSPNQKRAAFRIHAFPLEGGAKEYLFVLDLETGKEVINPITKDFFNSYEFVDDVTLKVDEEIYQLN